MTDPIRRKILKTGAAATLMAAASFYERGPVRSLIGESYRALRFG